MVCLAFTTTVQSLMAFGGRMNWSQYFQRYIETLPIAGSNWCHCCFGRAVEDEGHFIVKTKTNGQREESVMCRSVVIASGSQQTPKIPAIRSRYQMTLFNCIQPTTVTRRHYRLVRSSIVGSGQSGCQIAEDLLAPVGLCTCARVKSDVLLAAIEDETY